VELANARVTLLRNQNQVRQNAAALRASMGLPVGPAPTLAETAQQEFKIPSLEESVAEANRNHPQIQQDVANVESARYQLRLAGLQRRPIFTTVTSLNVNPRDDRTKSDWTIQAGITMPLWDAGVTRARQQEARYRLESSQAQQQQTRVDISTSVQQAILNMQSARERLDASAVAVESATRNLEAANARYQQGVVTVIEITTAQVNSFDAQNNAISARYDYYLAYAQLQRAVGRTAVEAAANAP
jgi:outer membrane protein